MDSGGLVVVPVFWPPGAGGADEPEEDELDDEELEEDVRERDPDDEELFAFRAPARP